MRKMAEKWKVSVSSLYRRSALSKKETRPTNKSASTSATKKHNKGMKINKWDELSMRLAINDIREGTGGIREIARKWNVPKSTLQQRIKCGNVDGKHLSGRKPLFSKEIEEELTRNLKKMSSRGFPLTSKEIKNLAFQYAQENETTGFSTQPNQSGRSLVEKFHEAKPNCVLPKT